MYAKRRLDASSAWWMALIEMLPWANFEMVLLEKARS
jgi:hypothetical protein